MTWKCNVRNLSKFTDELDLNVIFWGLRIQTIQMDKDEYGFKGSVTIGFESREDLFKALMRDGMKWEDKIIIVDVTDDSFSNSFNNDHNENDPKKFILIPMVEVKTVTDMVSKPDTPQEFMDSAFISLENGDFEKCVSFLYKCAEEQLHLFCEKHKQDVKPGGIKTFLSRVCTRLDFEWSELEYLQESKIKFSRRYYHSEMARIRKFCNYLSLITTLRDEESTGTG